MEKILFEKTIEVLSKDIKGKSLEEVKNEVQARTESAFNFMQKTETEKMSVEEKVKFLMLLGMGRDRTIAILKEDKVNRDHIKAAREAMSDEETEFRLESEKLITKKKIESGNRIKRLQYFEEKNLNWEELSSRYLAGESLNKLTKEYNVKVNYVTEQLKDDGTHDESRSTLLKNNDVVLWNKKERKWIVRNDLKGINPCDFHDVLKQSS